MWRCRKFEARYSQGVEGQRQILLSECLDCLSERGSAWRAWLSAETIWRCFHGHIVDSAARCVEMAMSEEKSENREKPVSASCKLGKVSVPPVFGEMSSLLPCLFPMPPTLHPHLINMTDFIIADFTNPPKKRKITNAARACDTCRRNKKRCIHTDGQALRNSRPASDSPAGKQKSAPPERPPTSRSQRDGGPETYTAAPQIQTPSDSGAAPRFIGHLNPEVAFLARSGPDGQQPAVRSSRTIGVWQSPNQSGQATSHPQMSPMSLLRYSSGLAQSVITPVVHDQFFGALPPAKDLQYLETFYFDNIHVIMPLIDKAAYAELDPSGPDHVLLSLGICLLASMSPSMKEHLHVGGENTSISHAEFGRRVFAAMRIAVDLAMVTDRITLIRSLTIMSMFNNGEADLEMSSQMMFRAVSIGYTVGLHQWMRTPEEEESLSDLFCCLWSMDKLLAAIQGRPVIMHEVDMAKFPSECVEKRPPAFRAFIRISLLLDAIIALYRPVGQLPILAGAIVPRTNQNDRYRDWACGTTPS